MPTTTLSPEKVRKIWRDSFTKNVTASKLPFKEIVIISGVTNVLIMVLVLLLTHLKRIPPEVPLFYGSAEGSELGANWQLILPQGLSLITLFINTLLSYFFKDEFVKKTLIIGAFTVTLLASVTTLKVIFLVGYF